MMDDVRLYGILNLVLKYVLYNIAGPPGAPAGPPAPPAAAVPR